MKKPFLHACCLPRGRLLAPTDWNRLDLWWLGQSGFLVQWNGHRVLIDPYLSDSLTTKYADRQATRSHGRARGRPMRLGRINVITASHGHTDHLDGPTLRAIRQADREAADEPWNPIFVAPRAVRALAEERWGGDVDVLVDDYEC